MAAGAGELFGRSEWAHKYLCEASLRLLAALGAEPRFPDDVAGLEALLDRVATGRPTEPMDFAVEPAGELPRFSGEYRIWVSPAGGCGSRAAAAASNCPSESRRPVQRRAAGAVLSASH